MRLALTPGTTTTADAGDDQATAATLDTPLTESGLTPRALSMLEPTGIKTVGQLIAVDLVWLNRFPGVAKATRTQVVTRVRAWRKRILPRS